MPKPLTPSDARVAIQNVVDEFERKTARGHELSAQWMIEVYEASKEIINQLDRIEEAGVQTRRNETPNPYAKLPTQD